ncbi:MAG: serine hydrolase, partial [candidate division KSB1 bacterium]|nr:serine hydrolase [candidate division KSB1 bacterium]
MKLKSLFVFSLFCLALSCGKSTTGPEPYQPYDWPTSTPDAQGVDGEILSTVLNNAGNHSFLKGVLIVRNGFLIAERYYRNYDAKDAHNIMSVSKSFLSALIAIAVREGFIDSLDRPIIDYFPEYNTATLDPDKKKITIRHLLSMRSGIDSDRNIFFQVFESSDPVAAGFHYPLRDEPGARFIYTTVGTHILCALLSKATGISALEFAQSYLFEPLGISISEWRTDPDGYYIGGSDMYFAPRDMARFGDLYMNDGFLNDVQIVPQD